MISVDAYPFLAFLDLTCHLEDTEIGVFWLQYPNSKETEFRSSDQEASPSAGMPCCTCRCFSTAISLQLFVMTDEFSVRITKSTSKIGVS